MEKEHVVYTAQKINNISVKFGKEQVLKKNVNIHVHCGELTVIIGREWCRKIYIIKSYFRRSRAYWKHKLCGYER